MSNDERAQDVSKDEPDGEADTAQLFGAPEPPPSTPSGRWAAITGSARRHPAGLAIGSAAVGLVVGLLGGLAVDAHPMMSLTVGTAAVPAVVDRPDPIGPPPGPPGERGGPAFDVPQGPPPPPAPGPRHPGVDGPDGGPGPGQRPPVPPNGEQAPPAPGARQPTNPGGDAPQPPPLPAERGSSPQA